MAISGHCCGGGRGRNLSIKSILMFSMPPIVLAASVLVKFERFYERSGFSHIMDFSVGDDLTVGSNPFSDMIMLVV